MIIKNCFFFFFIFALFITHPLNVKAFTVLIDPGHGGKDLGAVGIGIVKYRNGKQKKMKIYEKDLALKISLAIYEELKKIKGLKVYLTRTIDRTVPLEKRVAMADKIQADLFLSIHANAVRSKKVNGFETFYLTNKDNLARKKLNENDKERKHGHSHGLRKTSEVSFIINDLLAKKSSSASARMAKIIHQKIKQNVGPSFKMKDRGLRPDTFYVLALAKRPSVLLEVGYISHQEEVWKLRKQKYRETLSLALKEAIKDIIKSTKI